MNKLYIKSTTEEDTYWSNEWGWTDLSEATPFNEGEDEIFLLPIGGEWVTIEQLQSIPTDMKNKSALALAHYIDQWDDEWESLREFIMEGGDPKTHILYHAAVVGEWEDNFWDNVRKYEKEL